VGQFDICSSMIGPILMSTLCLVPRENHNFGELLAMVEFGYLMDTGQRAQSQSCRRFQLK
jgi:hypothetical protein